MNCPTCRKSHQQPEGGMHHLPNDFKISNFLGLHKKLSIRKSEQMRCTEHGDPFKLYCQTCSQVICRDCTFSEKHSKHQFQLISECYPKHYQQIQEDLDLLKHKTADIDTAVTALVTREREVVQQEEKVKKQIHMHAQQLIDQVQRSEKQLLQQVETVVQQKRHLLTKQKEQAERVHNQLKTCQDMVETSLKEWSQLQIMMEKSSIQKQMTTVGQHTADSSLFQPIERTDIQFTVINSTSNQEIGEITSSAFGKATLNSFSCLLNTPSTTTLTLQSHDGSPFSLPPSLISCKLYSPAAGVNLPIKCDLNQTKPGEYKISFIPSEMECLLIVQVGGVDVPDSPFTLPVISSNEMTGKKVHTLTRILNWPHGMTSCGNGDIIVAEHNAHCVTIVNKEGKKLGSIGMKGIKNGEFTHPRGVAISSDGLILVTDEQRIQKLTFEGVCVKAFGNSQSGSILSTNLYDPIGIAVHPITGEIFVADKGNNCVQVFNSDLSFSHTFKTFNIPYGLSFDDEGRCLYVAERGDHCITKLTSAGEYIASFGSLGSASGLLNEPTYLTIKNNLVYVSEWGNRRVSIFDTDGSFHYCFGDRGCGEGEFNRPHGITMDSEGNLCVCDTYIYNGRLAVLK